MATDALPIDTAKHELTQQKRQRSSADKTPAHPQESDMKADSPAINGLRGISHTGLLLRPGDKYNRHPVADAFPRDSHHLARLRASLEKIGQQTPVRYRILPDGSIEVVDGLSRIHELHGMEKDVEGRELTDLELGDQSLEEWICAANFGNEGRLLSDVQRSLQVVSLRALVERLQEKATIRRTGGKSCDTDNKARVSEELAKIANVKPNRIEAAFKLRDVADEELRQLVWDGRVLPNKALKIAAISDPEKRRRATAFAGDKTKKRELAALLSKTSLEHDPFGYTILSSMRVPFEHALLISAALEHIDTAIETIAAVDGLEPRCAEELSRTRDSLRGVRAYAVCMDCEGFGWSDPTNGVKCQTCRAKGWLTADEFNVAASEREAALPKAR